VTEDGRLHDGDQICAACSDFFRNGVRVTPFYEESRLDRLFRRLLCRERGPCRALEIITVEESARIVEREAGRQMEGI
jgi:hypothetical protein